MCHALAQVTRSLVKKIWSEKKLACKYVVQYVHHSAASNTIRYLYVLTRYQPVKLEKLSCVDRNAVGRTRVASGGTDF